MPNTNVVFSASVDNAQCWESSATPQPVPWWSILGRRVAGFVGVRKYLSMVDTMGILEGHGHHQEACTVASGQRMSQDETVVA